MNGISPVLTHVPAQDTVCVRGDVPLDQLPAFFATAFGQATRAAAAAGLQLAGPAFGYYPEMPGATVAVEAGFSVTGHTTAAVGAPAHRVTLPGGPVVQVLHVGPYGAMPQTYAALEAWMAEHDVRPAGGLWEEYLSDPDVEPDPATWRTMIVWPIA